MEAEAPQVLVLGDGDLSYSAALSESKSVRLVTTTLESREELQRRYPLASAHIEALEEAGATVLHGVDATSLEQFTGQSFQRIIFNFPYQATGGIKGLRSLLGAFLDSCVKLLAPDGFVEVVLCAGQGGTSVDGKRGWAGSWRVPLLAARAMLALQSVELWQPPAPGRFCYTPMREPGNKDTLGGSGGKPFPIDGALLHRLVHCPKAMVGRVNHSEAGSLYLSRLNGAREALVAALGALGREAKEGEQRIHPLRGLCYGPRFPRCHGQPDAARPKPMLSLHVRCTEGELCDALRAVAHVPVDLRWAAGDVGALEVLVRRPDFTPCFAQAVPVASEDWMRLCSCADTLSIDLEVLAMLRLGLQDRRQLWHMTSPVCQCLFFHDLRIAQQGLDELQIMDMICQVCGEEILLEAFELQEAPSGQRHWRIFLCSVATALDEKAAYQAYQAVRHACGVTLC